MGIASVLWRVFSTLEDNISTLGVTLVQWGVNISIVKGIQYNGGYLQYSGGILSVPWGITSVMWRLLSIVEMKI